MAVLNGNGVEIQKLAGILGDLQAIARRKFADIVAPNDELDVSASSVLGRILGTTAEGEALNEEVLLMIWQSLDPNQAEGLMLDKSLGLGGLTRKLGDRGFSGLMLHGTIGVTVPERSLVASRITGDIFETSSDVTFSGVNANGVTVSFNTIVPDSEYKLGYTSSYGANTYPTIAIKSVTGDTKEMIAKRFMETVKTSSDLLSADVDNDDNVIVSFKNKNHIGTFTSQSPALDVIHAYMPVSSLSVTADAGRQSANTLDTIQSAVVGWLGVTNPFDSLPSQPVEDDATFRTRGKLSKAIKSVSNRVGMYTDLYDLNGVVFANIKENIQVNEAGGVAGKGISVVVLGGDDDEIAEVIHRNRNLGCVTSGTITKTITDVAGSEEVSFSRPEFVNIKINLGLTADKTFPQNGKVLIQEALVRYIDSLEVGESVVWSKLFNPINEVQGQSVNSLTIAKNDGPFSTSNIDLRYFEMPVITFEDIKI